jgi:hypothetical protein
MEPTGVKASTVNLAAHQVRAGVEVSQRPRPAVAVDQAIGKQCGLPGALDELVRRDHHRVSVGHRQWRWLQGPLVRASKMAPRPARRQNPRADHRLERPNNPPMIRNKVPLEVPLERT